MTPATPVTIELSKECLRFLLDTTTVPVEEIRELLKAARWVLVVWPRLRRAYVIGMSRLQTLQLLGHISALRESLSPGDPRSALCEQCIVAIETGIKHSRAA